MAADRGSRCRLSRGRQAVMNQPRINPLLLQLITVRLGGGLFHENCGPLPNGLRSFSKLDAKLAGRPARIVYGNCLMFIPAHGLHSQTVHLIVDPSRIVNLMSTEKHQFRLPGR